MRPEIEEPEAVEGSTYAVTVEFTDEEGAPVTPNAGGTWTLTDGRGVVVNGRAGVPLAAAQAVTIVLSGADLALPAGETEAKRLLRVECSYNSSLGSNLPFREECRFAVRGLASA